MKVRNYIVYRIIGLLFYVCIATIHPMQASAQDDDTEFDEELEKTAQIIVIAKSRV